MEWREAFGKKVGVDEVLAVPNFRKELACESCFSCSVGTGNDDDGGGRHGSLVSALQHLDEGVLGDVDFAELLHFCLTLFLLF